HLKSEPSLRPRSLGLVSLNSELPGLDLGAYRVHLPHHETKGLIKSPSTGGHFSQRSGLGLTIRRRRARPVGNSRRGRERLDLLVAGFSGRSPRHPMTTKRTP